MTYVLLYLLLRDAMAAQAANAISLLATAVADTAVNRRVTFGIRGRRHAARPQVRGLIAFGVGLALTSGGRAALHAASARPSRAAEVAVLVAANLAATVVRFALYWSWVFRAACRQEPAGRPGSIHRRLAERKPSVTTISAQADQPGRRRGRRGRPLGPAATRPPGGPGLGQARAGGAAPGHRPALHGRP